MKMSMSADEISAFEDMNDADLATAIRQALKEFRAARGGKDDEQPDATTTGAKGGPKNGAALVSAEDAALKKLIPNLDRLDGCGRL